MPGAWAPSSPSAGLRGLARGLAGQPAFPPSCGCPGRPALPQGRRGTQSLNLQPGPPTLAQPAPCPCRGLGGGPARGWPAVRVDRPAWGRSLSFPAGVCPPPAVNTALRPLSPTMLLEQIWGTASQGPSRRGAPCTGRPPHGAQPEAPLAGSHPLPGVPGPLPGPCGRRPLGTRTPARLPAQEAVTACFVVTQSQAEEAAPRRGGGRVSGLRALPDRPPSAGPPEPWPRPAPSSAQPSGPPCWPALGRRLPLCSLSSLIACPLILCGDG